MSKYDALREYLEAQSSDAVTLTFVQLDAIVKLPAPAKRYEFWWSNEDVKTTVHMQSKAWQDAGYLAEPNLRGKRVTFRRKPDE
ncbi:MAG: hypothetical protein JWR08_296 [Enterovirga sp.]|jgi:hypothetical protein|nr:hypothetical protein [Enterovirga sp.]